MMAIALAIVWEKRFKHAKFSLFFFITQLLLNVFWSILFFGFKNPTFAFVDILFLNTFIILTIISFWKTSKLAGAMLIPYILWCSFAMILNGAIVYLN
jgi:tryptophan-rich sensory protein